MFKIGRSLILVLIILISSCTVQKRRYQPGFTFSRHKSTHAVSLRHKPNAQQLSDTTTVRETSLAKRLTEHKADGFLQASGSDAIILKKPARPHLFQDLDSCDVLIYRDGSEVQVKVIEIGTNQIRYRKCANQTGPVYVESNSKLFMIRFADGSKHVFLDTPKENEPEPATVKVTHRKAKSSLVLGILSLILAYPIIGLILGGLAISQGNDALNDIRAYPNKFEGNQMANAGRILGIIAVCFQVFIILVLVLVFLTM